jgi:hypothetical protein
MTYKDAKLCFKIGDIIGWAAVFAFMLTAIPEEAHPTHIGIIIMLIIIAILFNLMPVLTTLRELILKYLKQK